MNKPRIFKHKDNWLASTGEWGTVSTSWDRVLKSLTEHMKRNQKQADIVRAVAIYGIGHEHSDK